MNTPRSRTGKLMQGLFERFGKKNQTVESKPDFRTYSPPSQPDIEFDEFPITGRIDDDDEDTNWDDVEGLSDNNQIVYPQPIATVKPPVPSPPPDVEDWAEALPAATVKSSTTQEARRSKNQISPPPSEDLWNDPTPTVVSSKQPPTPSKPPTPPIPKSAPSRVEQAIGLWTAMLQQFRRILPRQIRELSDAILTAIVVMLLTVAIWCVDGILAAPPPSPTAIKNPAPIVALPNPQTATTIPAQISPEQAFIDAIQAQLSEITSGYPDDIVQGLQVDLPRNLAIVRLNPVWYLIGDGQQDSVTDRMWLQAKVNHFSKLELQDAQGQAIARSPVVGQHMVILKRRQSY